jgi:hypothetical protein
MKLQTDREENRQKGRQADSQRRNMTNKIKKTQVSFYPRIRTVLFEIFSIGYNNVRWSLFFGMGE